MAKTFLFFRGPKEALRMRITDQLREQLPDAVWIAMDRVDSDPKRAHAGCMALTKEALHGPATLLCVDNESLEPVHWQAYFQHAIRNNINAIAIGVDIYSDENSQKKNLQLQNLPVFIASVDKYWCVKNDLDADEVIEWLKLMKRG
jgi:hypothetical protein